VARKIEGVPKVKAWMRKRATPNAGAAPRPPLLKRNVTRVAERRADPDDGRRALIELAEAGRVELREVRGRREGWLAEAIAESFGDEERRVLGKAVPLLGRLAEL
jgi:hypothetical protein